MVPPPPPRAVLPPPLSPSAGGADLPPLPSRCRSGRGSGSDLGRNAI